MCKYLVIQIDLWFHFVSDQFRMAYSWIYNYLVLKFIVLALGLIWISTKSSRTVFDKNILFWGKHIDQLLNSNNKNVNGVNMHNNENLIKTRPYLFKWYFYHRLWLVFYFIYFLLVISLLKKIGYHLTELIPQLKH